MEKKIEDYAWGLVENLKGLFEALKSEGLFAALWQSGEPEPLPEPYGRVAGPNGTYRGPIERIDRGIRVEHVYAFQGTVERRTVDVLAVQAVEYLAPDRWIVELQEIEASAKAQAEQMLAENPSPRPN